VVEIIEEVDEVDQDAVITVVAVEEEDSKAINQGVKAPSNSR
jgi:hypothetical protein